MLFGIFKEELKPKFILEETLSKYSQNMQRDEKNQYKFEILYEQLEFISLKHELLEMFTLF